MTMLTHTGGPFKPARYSQGRRGRNGYGERAPADDQTILDGRRYGPDGRRSRRRGHRAKDGILFFAL
jgi:hypothetical protein